jgi:hypothetical protein
VPHAKGLAHRARASLDLDAVVLAAPLLTLLVLACWRKGAFFRPDIVVMPALASTLAITTPQVRDWLRDHLQATGAVALATGYWIGDAVAWHHSVDSWRLPAAWICLAAGYGCARSLPTAAKAVALAGTALAGLLTAITGLVAVGLRSGFWTLLDERSLRFSGSFTYPSAVGLFLVIALVAGSEFPTGQAFAAARAVTVLGIVATDSRGAVVGLVVALCFRGVRRAIAAPTVAALVGAPLLLIGQRAHTNHLLVAAAVAIAVGLAFIPDGLISRVVRLLAAPALAIAGWLLLTQHHAVSGFDASWTDRGDILRGAWKVFTKHPLLGAGPDPTFGAHTLTGAPGIAYFTHNEPVEILISIGIVGFVVLAACGTVVVRAVRSSFGPLAMPIVVTVAAAGVVDFVWHFAALGLAAGIVAGASTSRSLAGQPVPAATTSAGDTTSGPPTATTI